MYNMFSQWFEKPTNKIGFEDVKYAIDQSSSSYYLLINTLSASEQGCLIKNTLPCMVEENTINEKISQLQTRKCIVIVYGKNSADHSAEKKYKQLCSLGFINVYLYCGGLFEWLLLQDIYGQCEFPTTSREVDILKYRPGKQFDVLRINSW